MQGVGAATGTWCGLGCVGLVVGRELVKFAEEGRNNIKNTIYILESIYILYYIYITIYKTNNSFDIYKYM